MQVRMAVKYFSVLGNMVLVQSRVTPLFTPKAHKQKMRGASRK
jgi:hypothetical protein